MKSLALILCLVGFAAAAEPEGPDEATRIKMVEYMFKTPMNEADPLVVSAFMKLDTQTLPKKLRDKAHAKQLEVDVVVKMHKGNKKGPYRVPAACVIKTYEGPEGMRIMGMIMGNEEIEGDEEEYIERKTNCTESQLLCEFSLNIVLIKRKGKPSLKHYFLMSSDPLMALVASKRAGASAGGNKYFGETPPSCH